MNNHHDIHVLVRRWLVTFGVLIVVTLAAIILTHRPALSHTAVTGWNYPTGCCSGQDCHILERGRVLQSPEGYRVMILPGEHPFVKDKIFTMTIPYDSDHLRDNNPDGRYHICLSPQLQLRCFFRGKLAG